MTIYYILKLLLFVPYHKEMLKGIPYIYALVSGCRVFMTVKESFSLVYCLGFISVSHFSFELWCWHTIWDLFLGSWLAERHLSKQNAFTILLLTEQTECLDRAISYLRDATKKEKKLPQLPDAVVKLFQCDHCLQLWVGHDTHSQAESNVQMINPNTE